MDKSKIPHEHNPGDYGHGIRKDGEKYICAACGAIVAIDHDNCPQCGIKVNMGRAIIELGKVGPTV